MSRNRIQGGLQPSSHLFSSWVVHTGNLDHPLNETEAIEYFKEVKKWITKEYKVGIINAVIHLDEVGAPHMHLISSNFIKRGDKCYWSKSRVFGTDEIEKWSELPSTWEKMHQKIWEELGKKYNFKKPGASRGFKNQEDYKVAVAKERFNATNQQQEIIDVRIKKEIKALRLCLSVNLKKINKTHPRVIKAFSGHILSLKRHVKAYENGERTLIRMETILFNAYHSLEEEMAKRDLSDEFIPVEKYER